MNNFKFNFSLFHYSCNCGKWYQDFKWLASFLNYRINPLEKFQKIDVAFRCSKCGKLRGFRLIVGKPNYKLDDYQNEWFVEVERRII